MTLAFDPSDDFTLVSDGLEAVTFSTRSGTATAIPAALRRRSVTGEAHALGRRTTEPGAVQSDVYWHFPTSILAAPPAPGDTITDASGVVWTVLQTESQCLDNRWRCLARNLTIAAGAETLIDVDIAIVQKDRHGGPQIFWRRWKANVRGHIQPQSVAGKQENDVRATIATHTILFQEDFELGPQHRLTDRQGNVYLVLRVQKQETIGELMQALVKQVNHDAQIS